MRNAAYSLKAANIDSELATSDKVAAVGFEVWSFALPASLRSSSMGSSDCAETHRRAMMLEGFDGGPEEKAPDLSLDRRGG